MKSHLLIFRFSALGDILMSVPVIDALARQYPELRITVVSRPYVGPIMRMLPQNVSFVGVNLKNYKGLSGIRRLYKELKTLQPTALADFHNVLRTIVLRGFFKLDGIPTAYFDKNRRQRKNFIKANVKTQQRTSFEGYQQVLAELGYPVRIDWHQPFSLFGNISRPGMDISAETNTPAETKTQSGSNSRQGEAVFAKENAIGVAPFAAHRGKIYPLDKMEQVVAEVSKQMHVYLFGAGAEERALMEQWGVCGGPLGRHGRGTATDEPLATCPGDGQWQYAPGFVGGCPCSKCLGCHASFVGLLGLGPVDGQCDTGRPALPSVQYLRQQALRIR